METSNTDAQPPPPYAARDEGAADQIRRISTAVNSERTQGSPEAHLFGDEEMTRTRNFLLYVLSLDYKYDSRATLSAQDRQHYSILSNMLVDADQSRGSLDLTAKERKRLAAYMNFLLTIPCYQLAIPVDAMVVTLQRFFACQDARGKYKGSISGLMHVKGLPALAEKLYMDRNVLIPRIILPTDSSLRRSLIHKLERVETLYFSSIDGIEGSTAPDEDVSEWRATQTVQYTATERGLALHAEKWARDCPNGRELSASMFAKIRAFMSGMITSALV